MQWSHCKPESGQVTTFTHGFFTEQAQVVFLNFVLVMFFFDANLSA